MPRIPFSERGNTPFERLLGHNPHILFKWSELETALQDSHTLVPELKEQVRRALAFENGSFADDEIAELVAYCSFTTASQMVGAILNLGSEDMDAAGA